MPIPSRSAVKRASGGLAVAAALVVLTQGLSAHDGLAGQIAAVTAQIAQAPANPELLLRRADLYRAARQWAPAHGDLDRALELDGEDSVAGRSVQRVAYRESARPTLIRAARGGDLVLQGRMWIEPGTGTVVKTSLTAADPMVRADVTVTFRPDATLAIWVPAEMTEYYKEARSLHEIVATATYSNVRRFQVNTNEKLGKPPGADADGRPMPEE